VGKGAFAGLIVCVGCTGLIDGPEGSSQVPTLPPNEDPGRVTLHRLNRAEYNNTVRDLLGTSLRPADDFPEDDRGYGYDNIADVLSLSPLQVDMAVQAAGALAQDALTNPSLRSGIISCSASIVGARPCIEDVIRTFGRRAWR